MVSALRQRATSQAAGPAEGGTRPAPADEVVPAASDSARQQPQHRKQLPAAAWRGIGLVVSIVAAMAASAIGGGLVAARGDVDKPLERKAKQAGQTMVGPAAAPADTAMAGHGEPGTAAAETHPERTATAASAALATAAHAASAATASGAAPPAGEAPHATPVEIHPAPSAPAGATSHATAAGLPFQAQTAAAAPAADSAPAAPPKAMAAVEPLADLAFGLDLNGDGVPDALERYVRKTIAAPATRVAARRYYRTALPLAGAAERGEPLTLADQRSIYRATECYLRSAAEDGLSDPPNLNDRASLQSAAAARRIHALTRSLNGYDYRVGANRLQSCG